MTIGALEAGRALLVTGTGANQLILPRDGVVIGFIYNSGTASPVVSLYDSATVAGASAANMFLNALALFTGSATPARVTLDAALVSGLVANITAGAQITFFVA